MSHAFADDLFRALAEHALGSAVASTLSLHGGRIFLAVALRARATSQLQPAIFLPGFPPVPPPRTRKTLVGRHCRLAAAGAAARAQL